ncbi:MAG: hypothetical protein LBG94_06000 [Treponema sp.]|jgi:hypothetical protein|nr:hypothetical protein [Treponema sp.]
MKKNFVLTLFAVLLAAQSIFISCQSTGKKQPAEEFSVHWESPRLQIGEIEFQVDSLMGKLKKLSVPVFYFPQEDAVVLRYRPEFTTYQQCWSGRGRLTYKEALQKYNEDYDARVLDTRNKKSRRQYGIVRGYLIWQQFQYLVRARGNMDVELGYMFKDKAPYFVIIQLSAEYIDAISRENNRDSSVITMYFTRTQAAELAALFDREFLDGLKMPSGKDLDYNTGIDDDY